MATSTRRTFSSSYEGPVVGENVKTSQSAKTAALGAQTQRLESTTARQQRDRNSAQDQAIYRGGGEYSTIGADGGGRPRGNVTSGGVAVGAVVPSSRGLVGGMPAPFGGNEVAIKALEVRAAQIAFERGPQVGANRPTPNLIDPASASTDVAPRYPQDRYYQSTTRQTWQWVTTSGATAGRWEVAAEDDLLPVAIESPAVQHYPALDNGAIRYRVEGWTVSNWLSNGTAGTGGGVSVLVNGVAATVGTTLLQPTGRLSVSVTNAGVGMMLVTIKLRQV